MEKETQRKIEQGEGKREEKGGEREETDGDGAGRERSPELGSPYKGFTTEAQSGAQRSSLFELSVVLTSEHLKVSPTESRCLMHTNVDNMNS